MQPRSELDDLAPQTPEERAVLEAAANLSTDLPEPQLSDLVNGVLDQTRAPRRRPLKAALGAVALVTCLALGARVSRVASTPITEIEGVIAINGQVFSEPVANAPPGAMIETGADSTARVGELVLAPNSRLILSEPAELRAGVVWVSGAERKARTADAEVTVEGSAWLVAEPAGEVDRVTARLDHHPPEASMRSLLLSITLPVVALGANTIPVVVVTDGRAAVAHDGDRTTVQAGSRWQGTAAAATSGSAAPAIDPRITTLQAQLDTLKKQVDTLTLQAAANKAQGPAVPVPGAPVRGTIIDAQGKPAANVQVLIFAGDLLSDAVFTDAEGRFSVEPPVDHDGVLYARREGRSAMASAVKPGSSVVLKLVEPGKISARVLVNGQPATGSFKVWTGPGKVAAMLPGLWGGMKSFSGDHFQLERPAADVALYVINDDSGPQLGGHAVVHVEAGREASITVELFPAESMVRGTVVSAATRKPLKHYTATLLLGDDSAEASYDPDRADFGFGGRSPGERQVLITAEGFKPLRVRFSPDGVKPVELGLLALEPL
jgi:hypothetical protein